MIEEDGAAVRGLCVTVGERTGEPTCIGPVRMRGKIPDQELTHLALIIRCVLPQHSKQPCLPTTRREARVTCFHILVWRSLSLSANANVSCVIEDGIKNYSILEMMAGVCYCRVPRFCESLFMPTVTTATHPTLRRVTRDSSSISA